MFTSGFSNVHASFFFFLFFFRKRSISALSQVGLFRFSSNTWEAVLNNRSLSTLVQGADRYARATSASAGKESGSYLCTSNVTLTFASWYLFFCVCCACAECLPHKWHVREWLQCSVHTGTLSWKIGRKKDKNGRLPIAHYKQKPSGSDLWPVNRCIPKWNTRYLEDCLFFLIFNESQWVQCCLDPDFLQNI